MYPPEGPWDFSAIGDDILGVVYERFLGHIVTVKHGHAVVEEKPEVRHAGGVYYTPRFVVDTIIRRVIGPKIAGKSPHEVLDVKILDPACGSGSFLVAAFQFLINHCIAAITANPALATMPATPKARKKRREIAFKGKKGGWQLAPDFKAALLTNCIHGVDIDQQAVEVTIMSLYLKMLEGQLPVNWQRDWLENELLPSLDRNIQCGNSLINTEEYDDYLQATVGTIFPMDEELRFRINRFDWASRLRGFGVYLDSMAGKERNRRGFDCIIGNPPYIRVQELNKWAPEECEFYKWKYKSAEKGNYDIYVVFTEKALSLLASDGLLGLIMPHKFWQAKYGEGLRKVITDGKNLEEIVDFTHTIVFGSAAIYTAIHIFSKNPNKNGQISVTRIDELIDGSSQILAGERGIAKPGVQLFRANHPVDDGPWMIVSPAVVGSIRALRAATTIKLGDITDRMAQGIRTSANTVYVLEQAGKHSNRFFSPHLEKEVELEPAILLPFLGAECMRRYDILPTPKVVLVPYATTGPRSGKLLPAKEFQEKYPSAWSYLKECESFLRSREEAKMDHKDWYGYVYPKNLDVMSARKIIVPDIVQAPTFSLDEIGRFAFVSGYAITLKSTYSAQLGLLLGILNSKPIGEFLRAVSTPIGGGWYRSFPQFMEQIPIKLPKTPEEQKLGQQITHSVQNIISAKTKLHDAKLTERDRKALEGEVESHENRVDEAVLKLYGVSGLPA